jgi:hypothetical protein
MANEALFTGVIQFSKGGAIESKSYSAQVDVAGTDYMAKTLSIATSDTSIALADIGSPGLLMVKNLDATNFVTLGPSGSTYPIKIAAGDFIGPVYWNDPEVHLKANTAAVLVELFILER